VIGSNDVGVSDQVITEETRFLAGSLYRETA
jgi:hypothetical protein